MMSAAGGGGPEVEEVFSIDTFPAISGNRTITNSLDLSAEGGMVWAKCRNVGNTNWYLGDSGTGLSYYMRPDTSDAASISSFLTFSNNGYTMSSSFWPSSQNGVGFSFRKCPNFFDIVTYTGTGSTQTISHNLGQTPGMIWIKRTSGIGDFTVWHKDYTQDGQMANSLSTASGPSSSQDYWGGSSVNINASSFTVGSSAAVVNQTSDTYTAYLFAHNNNDGGFGADGDKDIQKMGSYTGDGTNDRLINVGFEPQFVVLKNQYSGSWIVVDSMRGSQVFGDYPCDNLYADTADATQLFGSAGMDPQGFVINSASNVNGYGTKFYWWAIRRGTKIAETVGEVFKVDLSNNSDNPAFESDFPVDFAYYKDKSSGSSWIVGARKLYKTYWNFDTRNTKATLNNMAFDYPNDWYSGTRDANHVSGMWRESPGVFGTAWWIVDGTGNQTIQHNLGAVPEMIWSKNLNQSGFGDGSWFIAHHHLTGWDSSNENDRHTFQDFRTNASSQQGYHRDFTTTSIRLLSNAAGGYTTNNLCFAALFATSPGISKVGSYTGDGSSSQTIDCGFSNGTQWVLIKRADSGSNWHQFDSARGISSGTGNDNRLTMDQGQSEDTGYDAIDQHSTGFTVKNNGYALNASGGLFVFLAYAAP